MDFGFSEDQELLRGQVNRLLADGDSKGRSRAILEETMGGGGAGYCEGLWRGLGEMGVTGAAVGEDEGGVGLGELELCVASEELGRGLAPTPYATSVCGALEALRVYGKGEARRWIGKLASGELIGTAAFGEGAGIFDAASMETTIKGGKVYGEKLPVPDGLAADILVAAVMAEGEPALAVIELEQEGVERSAVRVIDPSRPQARVRFSGATGEVLVRGGDALDEFLDRMAVYTAFEQLGGAEAALESAREYALERYAFGRPIGSFQAIRHRLADMYIKKELARSNCYRAALALEHGSGDLAASAASARAAAGEAFLYAAEENVQIHGGTGFTWESDCQLYYRRARHLSTCLGGLGMWKERLVRALERGNEGG